MKTLHGGVGLTMTHVRESYWIPKLRQLTKRIIIRCHGCIRFRAVALAKPPTAPLPTDRTEGYRPFQVIGIDFAGPIMFRIKTKQYGKAYIMLYSCSLSRALYLDVLKNQTLDEFLKSLKRFIARRGRPEKIYSGNFSTFVAASTWLKKILKGESFHNFLVSTNIKWQFNLSRALWCVGQFERMVGIVKQALYKVIGKASLTWAELEDTLLDVEVTLNNRPLSYVEEDVQMPILTPSPLMYYQSNMVPEEDVDDIEDRDLRKKARHLNRCKDMVWKRWQDEYVRGLRERHQRVKGKEAERKVGDVMLIKGDERNRGHWKIGVIDTLIPGRDGIVRAVKLRAGKSYLERAVQHLYPLELACDTSCDVMPEREDSNEVNHEMHQPLQRFEFRM